MAMCNCMGGPNCCMNTRYSAPIIIQYPRPFVPYGKDEHIPWLVEKYADYVPDHRGRDHMRALRKEDV